MNKFTMICFGNALRNDIDFQQNYAVLNQMLKGMGENVSSFIFTSGEKESVFSALEFSLKTSSFVIVTGGIGFSAEDTTCEYISTYLGLRLEENAEAMRNVMNFWRTKKVGEQVPSRALNLSLVPVGATVLTNEIGPASAILIDIPEDAQVFAGKKILMIPEGKEEFQHILIHSAKRIFREMNSAPQFTAEFRICGSSLLEVEESVLPILSCHYSSLRASYREDEYLVHLTLASHNPDILGNAMLEVREVFDTKLLADENLSLQEELLSLLRENGKNLATAESCTGGLLAKLLTDVPGSSDVFLGTIVSYHNSVKKNLLDVSEDTLHRVGAVSKETALAMIDGLKQKIPSDAAIALTGIAGPGGAMPGKPVGLVYIAVRYGNKTEVRDVYLRRSRKSIRRSAAATAMAMLRRMILEEKNNPS